MKKKNIFKVLTVATAMLLLVGCKDVHKIADKKENLTTEVVQATGISDKNDREIFEGDILEIQDVKMIVKFGSYKYLESSKNNGHLFGVLYDGLGFYVECINVAEPDTISPFEPETLKNSQIIGNIYENPELNQN